MSQDFQKPENDTAGPRGDKKLRQIALIIAIVMVAMVFLVFIINIIASLFFTDSKYFNCVLKDHIAPFIGLPQVCAVSFAIVIFLRQTEGPFEFKILGIQAKGSSGQVVMWAFVFLSMCFAMNFVWSI